MPSLSEVHVDAALTDLSVAYFQDGAGYGWSRLAPIIPTPKQSNKYHIYTKAELLRTDTQKRAPNTQAAIRDYALSTDSFFCDVRAVGYDVSRQEAANADPVLDPEQDAVRLLVQDMNIALDVEAASVFFNTGIWGTDDTDEDWSDAASDPLGAIATGINTIEQNTGYTPNHLFVGAGAWWNALFLHPDLTARLSDNSLRRLTPNLLAEMIGVPGLQVTVLKSIRNTAEEGLTASYSRNFGDHALLAYVDPSPGPRSPTAAATFNWTGYTSLGTGVSVNRFDIPEDDAYPRIEVESALDFKVVGSDLGYFFSAVTS